MHFCQCKGRKNKQTKTNPASSLVLEEWEAHRGNLNQICDPAEIIKVSIRNLHIWTRINKNYFMPLIWGDTANWDKLYVCFQYFTTKNNSAVNNVQIPLTKHVDFSKGHI